MQCQDKNEHRASNWQVKKQTYLNWTTCTIETNDIAEPVSKGGFDSLLFGFAEYAEGEAERTFKTYKAIQESWK